ncbi:MAG: UTP--glucose-1-phosphate uridylyltransferase GalU [Pigmentiphaga sp.]|uniref:UTP--glucose-1-phosphate uridylyltransferase GalU n=1 Tax=Pigmentiphaga sp. TaxID=1977564 RepID=UPI0029B46225|nr:UTP--glucose-1-phosphate uridylyltransferase GalU [Pigmentiphaga sp.]MDX3906784.1 UTP--glucose-1-phosphate uridylyltransferase GalU [Pigmentiphaga sp.]
MNPVRIAVFPVAGLGTRCLPATKAIPKEMLPVVDKPLIQYAAEEVIAAGITTLVFITGRSKRAIEDHFDLCPELESELAAKNKTDVLKQLRDITPKGINFVYIRQPAPLGLGHAVLCAEPVVGKEPFAVILPDDLIDAQTPVTKQLLDVAAANGGSVLGVEDVAPQDTNKYGIVDTGGSSLGTARVLDMVEKPHPDKAPSTLAVVGRYVLSGDIFDHLRDLGKGAGGEIQLTDGITSMIKNQGRVFSHRFEGKRYDCGSKAGLFEATVDLGRKYHGL